MTAKEQQFKQRKTQDENWEMLTVLGMPWSEAIKLADNDREYLLVKVAEIKEAHKQRLLTDSPIN